MSILGGTITSQAPDEAGTILCHGLERDFGRLFAGYAAYVRNPDDPNKAFVMHYRNAAYATHAHTNFTNGNLSNREIVIPATTLSYAFEAPGVVMRHHSRLVEGHICFNLNPRKESPLVLQTVFNWSAAASPNPVDVALRMQSSVLIDVMETAAHAYLAGDAARRVKTPTTPTHYLIHYDMAGSSLIRGVSGNVARDVFVSTADKAALLAKKHGAHLFRFEGDGAFIAMPIAQRDVLHATKLVKEEQVLPLIEALKTTFDQVKKKYADIPAVAASHLKVFAQPGYLQPVTINGSIKDYDGDAFEKIRLRSQQPQRGAKTIVHVADMP